MSQSCAQLIATGPIEIPVIDLFLFRQIILGSPTTLPTCEPTNRWRNDQELNLTACPSLPITISRRAAIAATSSLITPAFRNCSFVNPFLAKGNNVQQR